MSNESSSGNPFGCFFLILSIIALWALVFGVNVNGKHYGVTGCDCNGVHVDK